MISGIRLVTFGDLLARTEPDDPVFAAHRSHLVTLTGNARPYVRLHAAIACHRARIDGWTDTARLVPAVNAVRAVTTIGDVYLMPNIADLLGTPRSAIDLAAALFRSSESSLRRGALRAAMPQMFSTRQHQDHDVELLGLGLTDADPTVRGEALFGLAALEEPKFADRYVELLTDTDIAEPIDGGTVSGLAMWALAAIGDTRVVPVFDRWLHAPDSRFGSLKFDSGPEPAPHEILSWMSNSASQLIHGVRSQLRRSGWQGHDAYRYATVCQAWGSSAAAAVPDLVECLRRAPELSETFADTLAAIGPAAADAVPILHGLLPRDLAAAAATEDHSARKTMAIVTAIFQISGDPALALEFLPRCLSWEESYVLRALRYLMRLGPAAASTIDAIRLSATGSDLLRIETAWAVRCATGDATDFLDLGRRLLADGSGLLRLAPEVFATITYAGELGTHAAPLATELARLGRSDDRMYSVATWGALRNDAKLRRAIRAVLGEADGRSSPTPSS